MRARRQGGRPSLPKDERRSRLVAFRVRPPEARQIRDAAAASGEPLAAWLRRVVLRAASAPGRSGGGEAGAAGTGGRGT